MANEMVIDGKTVEVIEYKGNRVITTRVMAEHHNLDVKVLNQKFRRNKKHFIENVDYFVVSLADLRSQSVTTISNMDRAEELYLFTESGYLRFVKTINDDRAWSIYSQLMQAYFEKEAAISGGEKFLSKSTENRKTIAAAWAQHGARDYAALTVCEYYYLFNDVNKRKKNMDSEELTLLSVFEFVESKKLANNPQIQGDNALSGSTQNTASGLIDLISPQNTEKTYKIGK
jgi:hypothetical protein